VRLVPTYTIGYPSIIGMVLWKNRENIILDQYLRAKNTGDDRLSNPYSYDLRKSFSRLYYQFKPDFSSRRSQNQIKKMFE
jgi:hypothetical protein